MSFEDNSKQPQRYMQIGDSGRKRRIIGFIAYVVAFVVIGGAFALLLGRFTNSKLLAFTLTSVMVGYMLVMGWLASRNIEKREQENH